jgi:hypothetical protein
MNIIEVHYMYYENSRMKPTKKCLKGRGKKKLVKE